MSDLDMKAIKARLVEFVRRFTGDVTLLSAEIAADIAALLAEVERLQRERAEWRDRADALMTEQMTQMRDLTAEVEALRARLTLTPEKIEAAIQARNDYIWRDGGIHAPTESGELRAALLAAGMREPEAQP